MKLVIQIPCFNEERTLTDTLKGIPGEFPGVDVVEILVIDDGSTDQTVRIAQEAHVDDILKLSGHQGLARAFSEGLKYSINKLKADIIVNTDADHQYPGRYIRDLIQPILDNRADVVVGCRPIESIAHFSRIKKRLQRIGSRLVQFLTGIQIPDATSGFRAYSKHAARKLKIFSDFSYTLETLIQASRIGLRICAIPIEVNPPTRPSRLFTSNYNYVRKQLGTILRIWTLYSPVKLFSRFGLASIGLGAILLLRFTYFYIASWPQPSGKIQSLIISSIFLLFGVFMILIGVIADLIAVNRRLTEEVLDKLDTYCDRD
jgi:glycosyltransferase involved in cell wall biosynthesis